MTEETQEFLAEEQLQDITGGCNVCDGLKEVHDEHVEKYRQGISKAAQTIPPDLPPGPYRQMLVEDSIDKQTRQSYHIAQKTRKAINDIGHHNIPEPVYSTHK